MAPIPQVNGFCADKVAESNKGPSRAVPGLSRLGKRGIMGSVASSLGSSSTSSAATTYFTGMSNYSTDLNNAISREVQIADMPIQLLENNVNDLTNQVQTLQSLDSNDITPVQTAIASLTSAASNMLSASVSGASVVTPTLGSGAAAGTYSMQVTNLGSFSDALSLDPSAANGLPTVTDPTSQNISTNGSYTLTVTVGAGTPVPTAISYSGGNLNGLAQAINNANAGVQATVVNVGSTSSPDYRLSLQSNQLGPVTMQLSAGSQNLLAPSTDGLSVDPSAQNGLPIISDPTSQNISTSGSYTLTVGSATPVSIPYAGGNLNGLAQAINTANAGVQATVVNVGSASTPDYRLSVQSNQAGQQSVQLSDGNQNLLAPSGTVGALAQYTVDGKQITSTTDTVTLAPGLTVMLTGTSSTAATVSVASNPAAIGNALQSFVSAYLTAMADLNTNRGQGGGPLAGQSIIYESEDALQNIANYSTGPGALTSMAALGVGFDPNTGALTFNQATFNAATSGQTDALTQFLGSPTGGGFLEMATNAMSSLLDPTSGALTQDITTMQASITSTNQQIADKNAQVTQLATSLTQQMSSADAMIYELQQQATEMQDMFTAMQDAQIGRANGA